MASKFMHWFWCFEYKNRGKFQCDVTKSIQTNENYRFATTLLLIRWTLSANMPNHHHLRANWPRDFVVWLSSGWEVASFYVTAEAGIVEGSPLTIGATVSFPASLHTPTDGYHSSHSHLPSLYASKTTTHPDLQSIFENSVQRWTEFASNKASVGAAEQHFSGHSKRTRLI